jgi:hypothetical protein
MTPADRCECRGHCAKHESRCVELFGQKRLFDERVEEPAFNRYARGRRLCAACATTFDPYRKARERRAERAASERQSVGDEYVRSYLERLRNAPR